MADCFRCGQHINGGISSADRETWGHETRYAHPGDSCPKPGAKPMNMRGAVVNYAAQDAPEVVTRPESAVKDVTPCPECHGGMEALCTECGGRGMVPVAEESTDKDAMALAVGRAVLAEYDWDSDEEINGGDLVDLVATAYHNAKKGGSK